MRSWLAALGGLLAAGGIVGLYMGPGISWASLGILAGVVLVFYIIARFTALTGFGEVMRGWLIGVNAGANAVLAITVYGLWLGESAGLIMGVVLGVLNFLMVFAPISQNVVMQVLAGWLNWLMPMSWLVTGLGALFFLLNVLGYLILGLPGINYFRILGVAADWPTGTFFMRGGWISNLNPIDTAFNMGNFAFVDKDSGGTWHKKHEAGHTLNLFAFGWIFHFIGALEENATPAGANALSERLAESHSSGGGGSNIPMWI